MPRIRLRPLGLAAGALTVACNVSAPPPGPPVPKPPPAEGTWRYLMRKVHEAEQVLDRELLDRPAPDLRVVVDTATTAAAAMREGYGKLEDPTVPGFAGLAREAESWLLLVALEARQAHDGLARDVWRSGKQRHCSACHDAHFRVHGQPQKGDG